MTVSSAVSPMNCSKASPDQLSVVRTGGSEISPMRGWKSRNGPTLGTRTVNATSPGHGPLAKHQVREWTL